MAYQEREAKSPIISGLENTGLPFGAEKFQDLQTAELLEGVWKKEKDLFMKTRRSIAVEPSNFPLLKRAFDIAIDYHGSPTFQGKIEDHFWHRKIVINADKEDPSKQIIIFSGWVTDSLAPIVYATSRIPPKIVRNAAYLFASDRIFSVNSSIALPS